MCIRDSYNPVDYDNNEVPVSVMANDLLTTYKYGWKTSYYQNTNDLKSDEMEEPAVDLASLVASIQTEDEETCESCAI